jgi:heme-degrading monooxygenase HmoA
MYVVTTRIDVAAEDAGEFASGVADSIEQYDAIQGLRSELLTAPRERGGPFVCTVEFDTREDFEAWVRSDAFRCTYEDSKALIDLRDAVQLDG